MSDSDYNEDDVKNFLSESHKFWDTQPVLKIGESEKGNYQYDDITSIDQVKKTPYGLPPGFVWDTNFDIDNPESMEELYKLLYDHYVEDKDNMFRFNYSKDFLQWVLKPPGWRPEWHVGIRVARNNKLCGFITAVNCKIHISDKLVEAVDINFLCVNRNIRGNRMATVLIREIRRLVNLKGIFQAIYTVGKIISKPTAVSCYYHRLINVRKLLDCEFCSIPHKLNMRMYLKLYSTDKLKTIHGMKEMELRHCESAHVLLNQFLSKYSLWTEFSYDEFCHWFMPREQVVSSFVVENEAREVVDFISVYHLNSSILNNQKHSQINAGYLFYYACTCNSLEDIVSSVLVWASKSDIDVLNALNVMDNALFFKNLKFGMGDGRLYYYLFNWRTPAISPHNVGIVLQ